MSGYLTARVASTGISLSLSTKLPNSSYELPPMLYPPGILGILK